MMKKDVVKSTYKWMLEDVEQHDENSFEYKHFFNVIQYAKVLARRRGLNPKVAETIAILHDVGRVKASVTGKEHGIAGAKLAKTYLVDQGVEDTIVETIVSAILVHSKKGRIDGIYEELIKDADALSHRDEFDDEVLSNKEKIRCSIAYEGSVIVKIKKNNSIGKIIDAELKEIVGLLKKNQDKALKKKTIHEVRVKIRVIRSVIAFAKMFDDKVYKKLRVLDQDLKNIYKEFEDLRSYQVYRNILQVQDFITLMPIVDGLSEKEKKRIARESVEKKSRKSIKTHIGNYRKLSMDWKQIDVDALMAKYKGIVFDSTTEDTELLHELRIKGKQLKALDSVGIIDLSSAMVQLLKNLHEKIGSLHDVEGLLELSNEFKKIDVTIQDANIIELKSVLEGQVTQLNKDIKNELFKMKLILRENA